MFELFCDGLSLFFIICGMLFLISLIFVKLISLNEKDGFFVVLKADEKDEDLYRRITSAFLEANMFNFLKVNKVVVLDYGVKESIKKECLSAFESSGVLVFTSPEEAQERFMQEEDEQEEFIC